uniref:MADF domain-containing protein n=1 Tax=Dicentrarchus labrax TaxID=13489 RepID=A0A8C4HBL9_DICLA
MMEERLIAAVKTFPELYNPAMREHKDVHWRAVGCTFRLICLFGFVAHVEEEAKKKWRNLRDKYRKERIAEKERRSGLAAEPKRTWKFMPLLQFLEPYVLGRSACSNTGHDTSSETDSPSASDRLSRPRRENSELSEFEAQVMSSLTARQDEDDYFGCSLAETLKRLPPAKKRLLRCRIEHIVYEVEFGDGQQCPVCVSRDTVCPEIKTETE